MKAAIHSPYLDTLGGGERYVISFAKVLVDNGWVVDLESKDNSIVEKLAKRFGLKLSGVRAVPSVKRGEGYDLCFWLSDGSIPSLLARKNILHFQRPFYNVDGRSLVNRMKLFRVNKVIVNSEFTKKWTDKEYPIKSQILYPPVDVEKFKSGKKENIILGVARFSQLEQSKRQDVLVEAFKNLYDSENRDLSLILAGGSEVGGREFVNRLRKSSENYPIKIIENPEFDELKDLYKRAKIFWSASGFGVNEGKEPQKVEHFGITVVEAMGAGALPIVFDAGGHREIIQNETNGFLWDTKRRLLKYTKLVLTTPKVYRDLAAKAKQDSQKYSYENFSKSVLQIV